MIEPPPPVELAEDAAEGPDGAEQIRASLRAGGGNLHEVIESLPPGEMARAMAHLEPEEQQQVLRLLTPVDAADVLDDLPEEQAAVLLEELPASEAAAIMGEFDSDDRADVLSEMGEEEAAAILSAMPAREATEARELLSYAPDTAGGVMLKEFIAYPMDWTVEQVLEDLRINATEYAHYNVQYFYVVDEREALAGVLRLRDMLLSPQNRPLSQIMIRNPRSVRADTELTRLQQLFEEHSYVALPVVDRDGHLLGVVNAKEVGEAVRKNASRTMLKIAGIFGGEELRSMPMTSRAGMRLSWLIANLVLSLLSAGVIALYEDTLAKIIVLAAFLPVVSNMSGNVGIQSIGLSLRELALGITRPRDLRYVLSKELGLSVLNGLVLGTVLAAVGYIWQGDGRIGLVVGLAMMLNIVIAGCLGGVLPLLLKRLRLDPALSSGPILTTISDMCGFFLVLSLAALALRWLH